MILINFQFHEISISSTMTKQKPALPDPVPRDAQRAANSNNRFFLILEKRRVLVILSCNLPNLALKIAQSAHKLRYIEQIKIVEQDFLSSAYQLVRYTYTL